jgi:antitoxin component YwqK of YwqJK toxin-antitoxin module
MKTFYLCFLIMISACTDNKRNGIRITYFNHYPERIKSILTYKNDTLQGPGQFFYTNGRIEQVVNYNSGKVDGMGYYFYQTGNLRGIRTWEKGKMVGFGNDFHDTIGWLHKRIILYDKRGRMIGEKEYTTGGDLIWEKDY